VEKVDSVLKFYGNYRGLVTSVADPYYAGRIQVQIYPMLYGVDVALLPWAVPAMPISSGSGVGTGTFMVPAVGTYVWCFFENGDIYQPVYFAEAPTATIGIPATAQGAGYPHTRVIRTPAGIEIVIDDALPYIQVTHPSGATIAIVADGSIAGISPKDISLNADAIISMGALTMSVIVTGDITVQCGGNASITAVGKADIKSTGETTIEATANAKLKSAAVVNVEAPTINITGALGVNIN